MKSNYRKLGEFIQLRDKRNINLITEELLGISIDKEYMPSVANVIGTDLTKYKIIEKNVFACNPMHVGRDEKLPVALYKGDNPAIVSPAYFVFEIIDRSILNEEYLMMWFRRSEFDRNCWFKTDGSVRGGISWNEICELELLVPDIEKQKSTVKAYKNITNRIILKQRINENLEKQAQALFKSWFVDYEPFDGAIPNNWNVGTVGDIIELYDSQRKPISGNVRDKMKKLYPYYGATSLMDYVDNYLFDGKYLLLGEDGTVVDDSGYPILQYIWGKFWVNNHAHIMSGKNGYNVESLYLFFKQTNVKSIVTGAVQLKINQANLRSIEVMIPSKEVMTEFNNLIEPIFSIMRNNKNENDRLTALRDSLLPKLMSGEIDVSNVNL